MGARKFEKTAEKAELCELSFEEMGAVQGGRCDLVYLLGNIIRTLNHQGPGPLESMWISQGCPIL